MFSAYVSTGTKGIRITGMQPGYTSNSIFLPAAGYGIDNTLKNAGEYCHYWSNTQYNGTNAYCMSYLTAANVDGKNKQIGTPIRPVRKYN